MGLFDASVTLSRALLPPTLGDDAALLCCKQAVEAMPGAGSITVRWQDHMPGELAAVTILESDNGIKLDDGARSRLAILVTAEIRKALYPPLRSVGD